jgi:hypothetical protein
MIGIIYVPPFGGTALSACIFCPVNRAKGYRFYPLRESKPLKRFGFFGVS